jgi:hypothetical protein
MDARDKSANAIRKFGDLSSRAIASDPVHERGSECVTRADCICNIDGVASGFDVFSRCQHRATAST